jgi:hypothetical protein
MVFVISLSREKVAAVLPPLPDGHERVRMAILCSFPAKCQEKSK